jgi:hypothetical protein
MLKLNLTKRQGFVGKSINTRTEMHGKDPVGALDIPVSGILVNMEELNILCDEPSAWDGLYKKNEDGLIVARIPAIASHTITHKFKGAQVRITGNGLEPSLFVDAAVKDIVLLLVDGGNTTMSCKVQVVPETPIPTTVWVNKKISIGIKAAEIDNDVDDDEPELPLEHDVGTPQEEREKAHARERAIAQELEEGKTERAKRKPRRDVN